MTPQPPPGSPVARAVWNSWLGTYVDVVLLVVAAMPLALLVVWVLARHRRRAGVPRARAWQLSAAEVGMVYGTVPFVWLTMLPGGRAGSGGERSAWSRSATSRRCRRSRSSATCSSSPRWASSCPCASRRWPRPGAS